MAITFQNQNITFTLRHKLLLRQWIQRIAAQEKKQVGQVNYVFMSDDDLLQVNQQFLNHNTYTDIITFDDSEGKTINGDILISIDRVKDNAKKFDIDHETELRRVLIHGILHLCGYKDKTKADAALMRQKEDAALRKFSA